MLGPDEIEHRFGFHKATVEGENATLPRHRALRLAFRAFASELDEVLGESSREKALVFTALQEASMWAHCAVAVDAPLVDDEEPEPDDDEEPEPDLELPTVEDDGTVSAAFTLGRAAHHANIALRTADEDKWVESVGDQHNLSAGRVELAGRFSRQVGGTAYNVIPAVQYSPGGDWERQESVSWRPEPGAVTEPVKGQPRVEAYELVWDVSPAPQYDPKTADIWAAFVNGNPLRLVGPGARGNDFRARCRAAADNGRRVGISLGGEGYDINLGDTAARVRDLLAVDDALGGVVTQIDFDMENAGRMPSQDQMVRFMQETTRAWAERGKDLQWHAAPGGSAIATYWRYAPALANAVPNKIVIGKQAYDYGSARPIPISDARQNVNQARGAGAIPKIGMKLASGYWNIGHAQQAIRELRPEGGAYLWDGSHPQAQAWIDGMKDVGLS